MLVGNSGAYRVVRRLGLTGATARVFQVEREQDKKNFALKLMQSGLSPEMQTRFREEMVNLQRLRAAEEKRGRNHIPRIIESSDLQQPRTQELLQILGTPFIVMDLAGGTEVDTLLMDKTVLYEAEALEIMKQFAEVLEVIHREGLTYTDMKLGNLFWNAKKEHLTVIDWNVIAENKLEDDAPKDRLRAAAYLFRMVTGTSIDLDISGKDVSGQAYRRWENFKKLSEGTRAFLIKAFHPDPASRHGNGRSQVDCTTEFLEELGAHAGRFKLSTKALMEKGKNALDDRQWLEAWVYLDLADRQSDIEADPGQFTQLQEDLVKAENEAKKLGRKAFFSGNGRYRNGLFAEALEDFERAMRDAPYDEEARLFAVLTRFALEVKKETFLKSKEPLEECAGALLKGHLDLAENALNRLPEETRTGAAAGSLNAEIEIRNAVEKGRRLLKEDRLREAEECFRGAYLQRDQVLYIEPLEENLGSLDELYHNVEDLKKLYAEGDAYFEEERFHEAAWVFWKAGEISQGSPLAYKKYQTASRFDTITKLLETGHMERALEECGRTSGRFGDEPKYPGLYARVIDGRCEQLRQLTDESCQNDDYKSAKEYIAELLKWKPDDKAAKVKYEDILKEIAGGYKEKIQQLDAALRQDASTESCEQAIRYVEDQGYARFPEGAQFIERTKKTKEAIAILSREFDDAVASGNLETQVRLLNKADARNWTLEQGKPGTLKKEIKPKILESSITKIHTHLRYGRTADALKACEHLLLAEISKEKEPEIQELVKTANELAEHLNALERVKTQKMLFSSKQENDRLVMLRLERNYLQIVCRIEEIKPDMEIPADIKQYPQNRETFLTDLNDFFAEARRMGNTCLPNRDISGCKKISRDIEEVSALLKEFENGAGHETGIWENWNREFKRLFNWLEKEAPLHIEWPADSHILEEKWLKITGNIRVKETISIIHTTGFDEPGKVWEELDNLASLSEDSPLAFWLHRFFDRRLRIHQTWKALDEETTTAEDAVAKYIEPGQRQYFENPLETVKEVNRFLSRLEQMEKKPGTGEEKPEEMLERGKQLRSRLEEFPRLKEKRMDKRLKRELALLHQRISDKKDAAVKEHSTALNRIIEKLYHAPEEDEMARFRLRDKAKEEIEKLRLLNEKDARVFEERLEEIVLQLSEMSKKASVKKHSTQLETLLGELTETVDDHIARLRLETQAGEEIEMLRTVSPEGAQRYVTRLAEILKKLLEIALSKPRDEKLKPFYELQNRMCEQLNNGDAAGYLKQLEQDPHFEEVVLDYIRRHQNILFELKKIKAGSNEEHREALLAMREKFGRFPEIENALRETETEISREKNREKFETLTTAFKEARREKEWRQLHEDLKNITPSLLDESQQEYHSKMKTETRHQLALRELLDREDLLQFLISGKNERTEQWLKALEWNVMEKRGALKPTSETLKSIEHSEILWLERGQLDIESFMALRRIKTFIKNIYNLNQGPVPRTGVRR